MTRIACLLAVVVLALAAPALAGNDDPLEILRGNSAPQPQPVEQPAPPTVVEVPVYYPQPVYYYYPVVRRPVVIHHHRHFRH
jgi:hypothetical protein